MAEKREFYETHGVEEYYLYDPDRLRLSGWLRQGEKLVPIAVMEGWVSPRLGTRFTQPNSELEIYRPDGRRFLSSVELERRANAADKRANAAEQAAAAANERTQRLSEYLRSLGIDPDQL